MKHTTREQLVARFHHAMELDVESQPRISLIKLRRSLLREEFDEVMEALDAIEMEIIRGKKGTKKHWANLLKELADLQYVLSGTVISFSPIASNFTPAFNRVHASNMSKLGYDGKPVYRQDGKVTKGPNYKEPKLGDLIHV